MKVLLLASAVLISLGLLTACNKRSSNSPSLPDTPQIVATSFSPGVREVISRAAQLQKTNPLDATANGRLGMTLHVHDLYGLADVCYQRARILDSKNCQWQYLQGVERIAAGKPDTAIEPLRAALTLKPDYSPAKRRLAASLLAAGARKEALSLYSDLIRMNPSSSIDLYGNGKAMEADSQLPSAIESYRKACQLFPSYSEAHFALAQALQRTGKSAEAEKSRADFTKYKGIAPQEDDPYMSELQKLNRSGAYFSQQGILLAEQGRMQEAASAFEQAVLSQPNEVHHHINLIGVYSKLNQPEKVQIHYQEFIRLDSGRVMGHFYFGEFHLLNRRFPEAEKSFRRALEIDPKHAGSLSNLGQALQEQGKFEEAEKYFRLAYAQEPGTPSILFSLGRLLVERGKIAEGRGYLLRSVKPVRKETPAYLVGVAISYEKEHDYRNAILSAKMAREAALGQGQTAFATDIVSYEGKLQSALKGKMP